MKFDIHAPMNRARELYVEAVTHAEAAAVQAAQQAFDAAPAGSDRGELQRAYDNAAHGLGLAEVSAGEHFDQEVCRAVTGD